MLQRHPSTQPSGSAKLDILEPSWLVFVAAMRERARERARDLKINSINWLLESERGVRAVLSCGWSQQVNRPFGFLARFNLSRPLILL